jgi:hypothetical protein
MSGKRKNRRHNSFSEALSEASAARDGHDSDDDDAKNDVIPSLNRMLTQPIVDAETALALEERLAKGACKERKKKTFFFFLIFFFFFFFFFFQKMALCFVHATKQATKSSP